MHRTPTQITNQLRLARLFKTWAVSFLFAALLVWFCLRHIDVLIATRFLGNLDRLEPIGRGLGSGLLVSGETFVISALALRRVFVGYLSQRSKSLFVATSASLSAFAVNDYVLKVVFGRLNPKAYFSIHDPHLFHLFDGNSQSSFPSGHMVLATAFLVSIVRLDTRASPWLLLLLGVAALALIVGDWHFVSDTLAGMFVGGSAGLLASELWLASLSRSFFP